MDMLVSANIKRPLYLHCVVDIKEEIVDMCLPLAYSCSLLCTLYVSLMQRCNLSRSSLF